MQTRVPPPFILIFSAAMMWLLHAVLPLARLIDPPWHRLGLLAMMAGVGVAATALLRFQRAGTTVDPRDPSKASKLVTDGVFAWSRNPMYLGLLLVLAGLAIMFGTIGPWLVPPLFVAALTFLQIKPEEQALKVRFGQDYVDYCRCTGRWIGRKA
jgi:protein-S-isoprenylcysteine O-methyltransferase Ste14